MAEQMTFLKDTTGENYLYSAYQIAKRIHRRRDQIDALVKICEQYLKVEKLEEAHDILSQAIEISKTLDGVKRDTAIAQISSLLLDLNQVDDVSNFINQVESTSIFAHLVGEIIEKCLTLEQHDKIISRIESIEEASYDNFRKVEVLLKIVDKIQESPDRMGRDLILRMLTKVEVFVEKIENSELQDREFYSLSIKYSSMGCASNALHIANKIDDMYLRLWSLLKIIEDNPKYIEVQELIKYVYSTSIKKTAPHTNLWVVSGNGSLPSP